MTVSDGVNPTSIRYGGYVFELRELFGMRGVRFGSPEDLVGFVKQLSQAGCLQEDMVCMVRAAIFREQENITRAELFELVAVAVGGTNIDHVSDDLHRSLTQLLVFLDNTMQSLWLPFHNEVAHNQPGGHHSDGPAEPKPDTSSLPPHRMMHGAESEQRNPGWPASLAS